MAETDLDLSIHRDRERKARHQLHAHPACLRIHADLHAQRLVHGDAVFISCCDLGDYLFSAGHLDRADVVHFP